MIAEEERDERHGRFSKGADEASRCARQRDGAAFACGGRPLGRDSALSIQEGGALRAAVATTAAARRSVAVREACVRDQRGGERSWGQQNDDLARDERGQVVVGEGRQPNADKDRSVAGLAFHACRAQEMTRLAYGKAKP